MITRRSTAGLLAGTALAMVSGLPARAADKVVGVGINLSFTGADAESAARIRNGAQLAFDEADIKGYKLNVVVLDDATATAGQYDPAQAATNARKFVSDRSIVGLIGPQMSGSGKAMAPILSQGDLIIITPSATNPDLTNPAFAAQYRPAGKPIFYRTVTTDAFQGPNMANFFAEKLGAKKVYVLDDSGAYGVGMADAFQKQAAAKGIQVLGRDRLDPMAADYSAVLTKIKSLGADSLYYGGVGAAGVKVIKQSHDILPGIIRGGGDGTFGADLLTGAGFPAAEGWYATIAAPHLLDDTKLTNWEQRYRKKFNVAPEDYSITAYDGAQVIVDAIKGLVAAGKPVTRDAVREAIATGTFDTLQGTIKFDSNGDLQSKVVSVFQIKHDPNAPLDDTGKQYHYIGVAPTA